MLTVAILPLGVIKALPVTSSADLLSGGSNVRVIRTISALINIEHNRY